MAGLDILNNGLRSVTGGVTKAYIKFEDERPKSGGINVTDVKARGAASIPGGSIGKKLKEGAAKAAKEMNSAANAIGGLMAGQGRDLFSSGNVFEVKFNPSELSFQAYGGLKVEKRDSTGGKEGPLSFVPMESRIMMNVPLVFDDFERTDAFMMEKFSDPMAVARTIGTSVANTVTGNTYSVRPQVEGFIAALRNNRSRKMTFFWGTLRYRGVLETVSAEYTMFNMEGHPIRANVNLGLLLVDENVKDNNMGDWEESYKKLFDKSSSLGAKMDNAGNLLNIKL